MEQTTEEIAAVPLAVTILIEDGEPDARGSGGCSPAPGRAARADGIAIFLRRPCLRYKTIFA